VCDLPSKGVQFQSHLRLARLFNEVMLWDFNFREFCGSDVIFMWLVELNAFLKPIRMLAAPFLLTGSLLLDSNKLMYVTWLGNTGNHNEYQLCR
jgi:hypothetical protein